MTTNILNIANAAAAVVDQTAETARPTRELPREGVALLRLRSYIEFGVFPAKNPAHKPQRQAMLDFELLHPDHIISGEKQDGTTYSFPDRLSVRVNIAGPTSRFGKLLGKMNYDGTATHMSQLIGKPFLGQLFHEEYNGKKYVNLNDAAGDFHIGAPVQVDALTNKTTEIPVPELQGTPQLFLWENAGVSDEQIQAMWDSVQIDGKNWIQEKIRENMDFNGSRTQSVVDSGAATIDTSIANDSVAVAGSPVPGVQGTESNVAPITTPTEAVDQTAASEVVDPLQAAGLA